MRGVRSSGMSWGVGGLKRSGKRSSGGVEEEVLV